MPAVHDYYWDGEKECDPPRYRVKTENPETNILPPGAIVIDGDIPEKKVTTTTNFTIENMIESLTALVKERDELRNTVTELQNAPKGPSVELVQRYRLTVRWTNGYEPEDEWGFESVEAAQARYDAWVNTFGNKFEPAEICAYQINVEGDKAWRT